MTENQIFSHSAQPDLVNKYFIIIFMTDLETKWLEVFTHKAMHFCNRAIQLFPAPLVHMRKALVWDF